jgi:diguanylate cyclase (GGDEF)-like protein/PAS domain S-box-containing protein
MNPDYKMILDSIADGVYFVDRDRRITFWNKGAERISGFSPEEVIGRFCHDNLLNHVNDSGEQLCFTTCPLAETMEDGKNRSCEVFLHHIDGHRVPIAIKTSPIRNEEGEIIGAVETFNNNSSSVMARRHIRRLEDAVNLDSLTGISNRRFMEIKIRSALDEFRQHNLPFGIALIDIDNFKLINDTDGHDAGDKALIMIARTLLENVRSEDVVARWGGDEFMVLFYSLEKDGLRIAAEKLRLLVEQTRSRLEGKEESLTISLGATLVRNNDDIASLIRRADGLLYSSKRSGRNHLALE